MLHARGTMASIAALASIAVAAGPGLTSCSDRSDDVRVESATASRTGPTAPAASDCLDAMDPSARAGQLLVVLTDDPTAVIGMVSDGTVGGVALRSAQPADVTRSLAGIAAAARVPAFVASDEEGGTVQRLREVTGSFPSARKVAATMTPAQAQERFEAFARALVDAGVTVVFGPSLDAGTGSDLGTRTFSDDPDVVAGYGRAIVSATTAAGALPVVKHWPGIGRGDADTHVGAATLPPIESLRDRDLRPFDAAIAAGAPAVMVSHALVPGLTDGVPASLSRAAITDELRGRQHFDGLVVTDSLGMGAVVATTPQDDAAEAAITAGADIALVSGGPAAVAAHEQLTDAISTGRIPAAQVDTSLRRIMTAKGLDPATCRRR